MNRRNRDKKSHNECLSKYNNEFKPIVFACFRREKMSATPKKCGNIISECKSVEVSVSCRSTVRDVKLIFRSENFKFLIIVRKGGKNKYTYKILMYLTENETFQIHANC